MIISIKNFGPIETAEFDLHPLTVFIGDNRQGKTMALVASTAMLGNLGLNIYIEHYLTQPDAGKKPELEQLYTDLISSGHAKINLAEFVDKYAQNYYTALGVLTPANLEKILGYGLPGVKPEFKYTLSEKDREMFHTGALKVGLSLTNPGVSIKIIKEKTDPILHIYTESEEKITLPKPAVMQTLLSLTVGTIQRMFLPNVYHFPSERAGFTQLWNQIQKLQIQNTPSAIPKRDEPGDTIPIPYSLAEYLKLLQTSLLFGSKTRRDEFLNSRPEHDKFRELAQIFDTISADTISLSTTEPVFPRKIQIKVGDTTLPVPAASSGVKGLIGLSLYLQYNAQAGDLLVIDEPEQNLHPNQQLAITEFIAMLVNSGIRVAITTHSTFVVEHLQNLILAQDLEEKAKIVEDLVLKNEMALLDKNDAGVYLFEKGHAEDILWDDGQINWQTFCDAKSIIDRIDLKIYRLRKDEDDNSKQSPQSCGNVAESESAYQRK
ncbi:MAG TPA: AAA family ATPase [Methanocorpusculum sp.]|nr:AAA family ATPase [Methanocorpusculum sp.]